MRGLNYLLLLILALGACKEKNLESGHLESAGVQEVPMRIVRDAGIEVGIHDFENFQPFLHRDTDSIYIVNFWATWCKPCIEELPDIERIGQEYKNEKLAVVLASLDFPDQINSNLVPFVKKMNLQSKILVLDEADPNAWIPKVDSTWSGAIPATLIYSGNQRFFYNGPVTYKDLQETIQQLSTSKK